MNYAIVRLFLGSMLIALSACGIEGSGITDGGAGRVAITSGGAVTGLGSIFVNGVEYDLAGALITIDGQPASESDLKVGSVVIVEGTINSGGASGRATRVTAGNAVAGRIESVAITHDGFTVLGQIIEIDAATVIENGIEGQPLGGLTVGSDIEVSGFADSSGTIRARRIAPRRTEKPLLVTGYVAALDSLNRRFAVNGAIVDYTNATLAGFDSGPRDGDPVRVTATVVDETGAITAEEVEYRDLRMPGAEGDAAILQGLVTRYASSSDFDVDGRRVVATTRPAAVSLNAFVVADGKVTTDGAVELEKLLFPELLGLPPPWTAPAEFDCDTAAPTKQSDVAGKPGGFWPGMLVDCVSGQSREVLGLIAQDGRFRIFSMWEDGSDLLGGTLEMDGDTFASYGQYFFSDGPGCAGCSATSLFVTGFVSDRRHLEGRWSADWGGYGYFVLEYDGIGYEDQISNIAWSTSLRGGWDGFRDDYSTNGVSWTVDSTGQLTGSDESGCTYVGTIALADSRYNLFEVKTTSVGCATQGTYTGFAMKSSGPFNDLLRVSMDDGEQRALRLFFFSDETSPQAP